MIKLPRRSVAVQPLFEPDHYGQIIIPDQNKSRCTQGIVKYLGADCTYVAVGDHVIFSGYTGTTLDVEGEGLLIVFKERFAIGVLAPDLGYKIPGLFFRDKEGYFPATYESTFQLIAKALQEHPMHDSLKIKFKAQTPSGVEIPTPVDYDDEDDE